MKRLSQWIGRSLLFLAFALFTAIVINPMRLGGEASGGKVEDARYFVVSKGRRYTEVSQTEWRIERNLERCFFVPLVLVWIGMAFCVAPDMQQKKPVPTAHPPSLEIYGAVLGVTAVGAGLGWLIGRVPWTAVLGAWLGLWGGAIAAGLLRPIDSSLQPNADLGAAPDRGDTRH